MLQGKQLTVTHMKQLLQPASLPYLQEIMPESATGTQEGQKKEKKKLLPFDGYKIKVRIGIIIY